jgi:hypothetical protein
MSRQDFEPSVSPTQAYTFTHTPTCSAQARLTAAMTYDVSGRRLTHLAEGRVQGRERGSMNWLKTGSRDVNVVA